MRHLMISALAAAALAGCGGSDSEDDRPPPPAEASEYVRRLDALCKEAEPELVRLRADLVETRDASRAGRLGLPETFRDFAVTLRRSRTVTERFEAGLRKIDAPGSERTFHRALVKSVAEASANLRGQIRAAEAQEARRLSDLSVKSTLIATERKGMFAGREGFRSCGQGPAA